MQHELIQIILIILLIGLIIYSMCGSSDTNEHMANTVAAKKVIKKPAPAPAKKIIAKKPVANSAVKPIVPVVVPVVASAETAPVVVPVAVVPEQPQDITVGAKLKFDDANYFQKDGDHVKYVGASLYVDQICIAPNKCINATNYDSIMSGGRIANYLNGISQHMYPSESASSRIYQNIFDAFNIGYIDKLGSPQFDNTTYVNGWNNRPAIKFGTNVEADGNGAVVRIPTAYDVVWVRVLNDRYTNMKVTSVDDNKLIGFFGNGFRRSNRISPDGGAHDSNWDTHLWVPIPINKTILKTASLAVPDNVSGESVNVDVYELGLTPATGTTSDFWISGIAFTKNPWNHVVNGASVLRYGLNGGTATPWSTDNINNESAAQISLGTKISVMIPVIDSGKDKLIYIVNLVNNTDTLSHTAISVEGKPVERLQTTYDNPFARHFNAKGTQRYAAVKVPKESIAGKSFVSVTFDQTKNNSALFIIEAGSHDFITL